MTFQIRAPFDNLFEETEFEGLLLNKTPIFAKQVKDEDFKQLWTLKPDNPDFIVVRGNIYKEHRCNSIFSVNSDTVFNYAGKRLVSRSFKDVKLLDTCMDISNSLYPDVNFNTAFVNWYSDGSEYVGSHQDKIDELVPDTPIISYSFMERHDDSRKFTVNNYTNNTILKGYMLKHGDCLIMEKKFQSCYKHAVPKTAKKMGKRINVTVRAFVEN